MGRKAELKKQKLAKLPLVSVCTPTYNRRLFFPQAIRNYLSQNYPKDKLEWIIIDDGTEPVKDLVEDIPGVKYYNLSEKMTLGEKRNLMHSKCNGSIIVYMDDDDYYPPNRVSLAVKALKGNTRFMVAGSSEMYMYFPNLQKIYKMGPYGDYHATAGTFAFKKEFLEKSKYNDKAEVSEEKYFLKDYSVPMIQLPSRETILVMVHPGNTFDKEKQLEKDLATYNSKVMETTLGLKDFIKDKESLEFYDKINQSK